MPNEIAATALWTDAVSDHDADAHRRTVVAAKVALSGTWPFLAAASSEEEFEHRLALVTAQVEEHTPAEALDDVVASLRQDFATLASARAAEAAAAAEVTAEEGIGLAERYAHVRHRGGDEDGYFQVDLIGPQTVQTLARAASRDEAFTAARAHRVPIYENGRHAELPPVESGQEFFHAASGRWVNAREFAERAQHLGAAEDDDDEGEAGLSHQQRVAQEYAQFHRSPDWELKNIHKALNMLPFLNGPQENARLDAIKQIRSERRRRQGVFTPDPTDAMRYNRYPTIPSPDFGGSPAGPGDHPTGPDGFPPDVAQGEQRSEEAYARQTTPGPWVVPPDAAWRDSMLPNAATGLPQGQYPAPGNPAVNASRYMASGTSDDFHGGRERDAKCSDCGENYSSSLSKCPNCGKKTSSRHTAQEGVAPSTHAPNPNYFWQGAQIAGPPTFPPDPGPEPKTNNNVDDLYGAVPPEQSSGSQMGQVDGAGYSRQGTLSREAVREAAWWWGITRTGGMYYHGREFDQAARDKAAKSGHALSDGSFPIYNAKDVQNAKNRIGTSDHDRATIVKHINHWAKEYGEPPVGEEKDASRHTAASLEGFLHGLQSGQEATVGEHSVRYDAQQALDDYGRPARGFTVGTYSVTAPGGGIKYFSHSPYKPDSWAGQAKRAAAEDAARHIWDTQRQRQSSVRHTAPGGGEHAPYRIKKVDGGYAVFNDKGERKNDEAKSYPEARRFQKALYRNVPGARQSAEEDEAHKAASRGRLPFAQADRSTEQLREEEYREGREHAERGLPPETSIPGIDDVYDAGYADRRHDLGRMAAHQATCPECEGTGKDWNDYDPCPRCQGSGQASANTLSPPELDKDHRPVSVAGWRCDVCGHEVNGQTDEEGIPTQRGDSVRHTGSRRMANTSGQIVGHCDHCHAPVRWHDGDDSDAGHLEHLHNASNRCSDGSRNVAKTSGLTHLPQFFDPFCVPPSRTASGPLAMQPAAPSAPVAPIAPGPPGTATPAVPSPGGPGGAGGTAVPGGDSNVPQASSADLSRISSDLKAYALQTLTAPTPENPTGRDPDEYRSNTWEGLVRQRPMQSAEERNVNTPTLAPEPIRTRNVNTPTPGLGDWDGSTRDEDDLEGEEERED